MAYQYSRTVRTQVVNRFHTPQQGGVRHVRGPYSHPRTRTECDGVVQDDLPEHKISIHALVQSATWSGNKVIQLLLFQSTHSYRVRLSLPTTS